MRNIRAIYKNVSVDRCVDSEHDITDLCRDVVWESGERNEPDDEYRSVDVVIHEHVIINSKMATKFIGTRNVVPFRRSLTEDEYCKKLSDTLEDVPVEFRDCISAKAWSDGHSSGYDEVISCAESLVSELMGPIRKFEERIRKETAKQ